MGWRRRREGRQEQRVVVRRGGWCRSQANGSLILLQRRSVDARVRPSKTIQLLLLTRLLMTGRACVLCACMAQDCLPAAAAAATVWHATHMSRTSSSTACIALTLMNLLRLWLLTIKE